MGSKNRKMRMQLPTWRIRNDWPGTMTRPQDTAAGLMNQLDLGNSLSLADTGEDVWIEVIQQMDRVYADLVISQVALEEKNEELQHAQDFIASVMSAMSDLLIVCDTDGTIQQVNDALERLTGLPVAELVGKPLSQVLYAADEDTEAEFSRHLQSGQDFSDCEVLLRDARGNAVPLSVNCSPRRDHRERPVGLVLIGRPMGELQLAYRELDHALKNFEKAQQHLVSSEKMAALGRLVAGVAHELNNPISFVFGNMYALKSYGEKLTRYLGALDSDLSDHDLQQMRQDLQIDRIAKDILPLVEGTLEGAERVSDIVQDLRRFSGNQKEPMEEFALAPVLQTAANWVLRGARHQPCVSVECARDLTITSKKGHLHQILVNLIQNAVDALEGATAPHLIVRAKQAGSTITLSVSDNGPGIPEAIRDQIFEPFFTTKPVGQGTGLGLYVSYRMADEIGGTLAVETATTSGSVFTLPLPVVPPQVPQKVAQ